MPLTNRSRLSRLLSRKAISFAHGTFAGSGPLEERLPWSEPPRTIRHERQTTARSPPRASEGQTAVCESTSNPCAHVRLNEEAGPLRCR